VHKKVEANISYDAEWTSEQYHYAYNAPATHYFNLIDETHVVMMPSLSFVQAYPQLLFAIIHLAYDDYSKYYIYLLGKDL